MKIVKRCGAAAYVVQVRKIDTDEIVKELGPKSERECERIERGLEINLNHEAYYTAIVAAEAK